MTLRLLSRSLPARYRANEEKNYGLHRDFLKVPAAQEIKLSASTFKKSLFRLKKKAAQCEYALRRQRQLS
jgi:hypothetical protein